MRRVPLLVTTDLEVAHDHSLEQQRMVVAELATWLRPLSLPLTVFATGDAAQAFGPQLRELLQAGHEVGNHGLTHQMSEDWRYVSESEALRLLRDTSALISSATGFEPKVFRGPRWETSAATQAALQKLGYRADFSVCPQRADLLTCRGAHPGWLTAPRIPYRPSQTSPFRRGARPLWVVPLSGLGLPFISGIFYLLGLDAMKQLFHGILAEARRTGAPIVYMFHTYEWTEPNGQHPKGDASRQPWYHRLYLRDRARRRSLHLQLFQYMTSFSEVWPTTASAFLQTI